MMCPKGIEEILEVIKNGMQVNSPPETFAVAVSILPAHLIDYLIESGANILSTFQDGESALHVAVRVDSMTKFKQIVRHNKDCLFREWRGLTPIETALVYYPSENTIMEVMKILENESDDSLLTIARSVQLHIDKMSY